MLLRRQHQDRKHQQCGQEHLDKQPAHDADPGAEFRDRDANITREHALD